MGLSRLSLALEQGDISLAAEGPIAVFAPPLTFDMSALPADRVQVITQLKPVQDYFAGLGYTCAVVPDGRFATAIICVSRAKELTHAMIADARRVTDGPIILDGQKSDGIESLLKTLRKRADTSTPLSKSHGKIFQMSAPPSFDDWAAALTEIGDGMVTFPGVFSADGIDPGSAMLAEALPAKLGAVVADLGAGWGYLSHAVLTRESVQSLYLVEADHTALDCARRNVIDPRAQFHWADALNWAHPALMDTVVMNPPFHQGRDADPALGRRFIQAAAKMLKPTGHLWMVANRHLPYETTLEAAFAQVEEVTGTSRFKILRAARPARTRR